MAEKILISIYKNFADTRDKDFAMDDFLKGIRDGKWQDGVLAVRTISDKKERDIAKKQNPMVTISGSFSGRTDNSIRKHSGFIAIDIDKIENPNTVKELLAQDKYIYASFISISGTGLCLIFKIDGTKHLESFEGIGAYLYETYQLIIDQSCKNVSRSRFVSYDPYMVANPAALLFKKYLPKRKVAKHNQVVFVQSDFDEIITQMYHRNVNICEDYSGWLSTAYALITEFGADGIRYFHTLSSLSSKYNSEDCERQYSVCLNSHSEGKSKQAHIGSIYYHAKQAGIDIYSSRTKEVIRATISQTRAGMSPDGVAGYLAKFQDIPAEESNPIIAQVVEKQIKFQSDNIIEDIQSYLASYSLRKNTITRNIEINGRPMDDTDLNSIYIDIKSILEKVTKDLVCSVIFSNRTEQYNPIIEFWDKNKDRDTNDEIKKLCATVVTDTEHYDVFILKWLVGVIASIHGQHSPLALVFTGGINKGKTEWFRRLLPTELQSLYTEEKLKDDTDAFILMTKKLIIMDDEWGGMSKAEDKFFKALMSKQMFPIREPYGRISVDLRRLSVFCGTSNEMEIISNPETNRRLLPINVLDIDKVAYNRIDKVALFIEAWKYYNAGYDWNMSNEDIAILAQSSERHNTSEQEEELLHAYFVKPEKSYFAKKLTNSEILSYLKRVTNATSMNSKRLGAVLKRAGFEQVAEKRNGQTQRLYLVEYRTDSSQISPK